MDRLVPGSPPASELYPVSLSVRHPFEHGIPLSPPAEYRYSPVQTTAILHNVPAEALANPPAGSGATPRHHFQPLQPPQARQLFEVIDPNATPVQRDAGVYRGRRESGNVLLSKGQLGTMRTMSHRGKKPTRFVKKRVINKIDSKTFFSNERTMYSWFNIGTIVVGVGLSLYGYISIDPALSNIGQKTGTVLSFLALLVFFYAAYHFLWRRRALARGMGATAFDDQLGSWTVALLLIAGLGINLILAWRSPAGLSVRVRETAFIPGDRCGLHIHDPHMYNPYGARKRNGESRQSINRSACHGPQ